LPLGGKLLLATDSALGIRANSGKKREGSVFSLCRGARTFGRKSNNMRMKGERRKAESKQRMNGRAQRSLATSRVGLSRKRCPWGTLCGRRSTTWAGSTERALDQTTAVGGKEIDDAGERIPGGRKRNVKSHAKKRTDCLDK